MVILFLFTGINSNHVNQPCSSSPQCYVSHLSLLQQKLNKQQTWGGSTTVRKQISGTASVAFTPMQGLEIVNPGAAEQKVREANEKYFSSTAGFMSVKQ